MYFCYIVVVVAVGVSIGKIFRREDNDEWASFGSLTSKPVFQLEQTREHMDHVDNIKCYKTFMKYMVETVEDQTGL